MLWDLYRGEGGSSLLGFFWGGRWTFGVFGDGRKQRVLEEYPLRQSPVQERPIAP